MKKVRLKGTDKIGIVSVLMYTTSNCFCEVEFEDGNKKFIHINQLEEIK